MVVVVGGMGSIPGAYVAALLIAEIKAICIGVGAVDLFGIAVLVLQADAGRRVPGDGGRAGLAAVGPVRQAAGAEPLRGHAGRRRCGRCRPSWKRWGCVALAALLLVPLLHGRLALRHRADDRPADRGAVRGQPALHHGAGRHALVRPRRLLRARRLRRRAVAEGARAADGAGAACSRRWSPRSAPALRLVRVRLSGVYLAMLTLAFAQIVWSVIYQWDELHRRQQRPHRRLAVRVAGRQAGLLLRDARCSRSPAVAVGACCSRPSATRCAPAAIRRCAPTRSASTCKRMQWVAFVIAGTAGRPGRRAVRVLQGQHLARDAQRRQVGRRPRDGAARRHPDAGRPGGRRASLFTWLHDTVARNTDYWRAMLGGIILLLVLLFPQGIAGFAKQLFDGAGMSAPTPRSRGRASGMSAAASHESAQVLRRRARRSTASASSSRPANCWR